MGLLYGRAGRLTDKTGSFRARAEKLEGLGTAEDCPSACCADDAGQAQLASDGRQLRLRRRLAGVVGRLLPAGPRGSSLGPGPPGA